VKAVLGQLAERLKPRILERIARDGHGFLVLRHPAGDALPHAKAQLADRVLMWIARGSEDKFVSLPNVDKARVALYEIRNEPDNPREDFRKGSGGKPLGQFMQKINVEVSIGAARSFHTNSVASGAEMGQSKFPFD